MYILLQTTTTTTTTTTDEKKGQWYVIEHCQIDVITFQLYSND